VKVDQNLNLALTKLKQGLSLAVKKNEGNNCIHHYDSQLPFDIQTTNLAKHLLSPLPPWTILFPSFFHHPKKWIITSLGL